MVSLKLIKEIRQWSIENLAKEGHNRGFGGKALTRRGLRGPGDVAPSRQRIFAVFT